MMVGQMKKPKGKEHRLTQLTVIQITRQIESKRISGEINGVIPFEELQKIVADIKPGHVLNPKQARMLATSCDLEVSYQRYRISGRSTKKDREVHRIHNDLIQQLFVVASTQMNDATQAAFHNALSRAAALLAGDDA